LTGIVLVARRRVRASARRVFDAWTEPAQLQLWWGPRPVTCAEAEVDLRVGGAYRIVNALPGGGSVTIAGEFRVVQPPRKLVFTWRIGAEEASLVTVRFEAHGDETEVIVLHEEIPTDAKRDSHVEGWSGCLEGLERYFAAA
jgi:uncharacterized protein YndB with AHSA1/START domain